MMEKLLFWLMIGLIALSALVLGAQPYYYVSDDGSLWMKANFTAGNNSFYIYYNDTAGSAIQNTFSPDDVFLLYDDFNSGTLNTSMWAHSSPDSGFSFEDVGSGKAVCWSDDDNNREGLMSNMLFNPNETWIYTKTRSGTGDDDDPHIFLAADTQILGFDGDGPWNSDAYNFWLGDPSDSNQPAEIDYLPAGATDWDRLLQYTSRDDGNYHTHIVHFGSDFWYMTFDSEEHTVSPVSGSHYPLEHLFFLMDSSSGHGMCVDYVYVIKNVSSTTISYSSEENGTWSINGTTYTHRKQVTVESNDSKNDIFVELAPSEFGGKLYITDKPYLIISNRTVLFETNLSANEATYYYIYYNGSETGPTTQGLFNFFDDFQTIDDSVWVNEDNCTIQDGTLLACEGTGNGVMMHTTFNMSDGIIVMKALANHTSTDQFVWFGSSIRAQDGGAYDSGYLAAWYTHTDGSGTDRDNEEVLWVTRNSSSTALDEITNLNITQNEWYITSEEGHGSNITLSFGSTATNTTYTDGYIALEKGQNAHAYWDWFGVIYGERAEAVVGHEENGNFTVDGKEFGKRRLVAVWATQDNTTYVELPLSDFNDTNLYITDANLSVTCQEISSSNTVLNLTDDLLADGLARGGLSVPVCFYVDGGVENVTIDCHGHTIYSETENSRAFQFSKVDEARVKNVSLKNCRVEGFHAGMVTDIEDGTIENVYMDNEYDVWINGNNINLTLDNSTLSGDYGIHFDYSPTNLHDIQLQNTTITSPTPFKWQDTTNWYSENISFSDVFVAHDGTIAHVDAHGSLYMCGANLTLDDANESSLYVEGDTVTLTSATSNASIEGYVNVVDNGENNTVSVSAPRTVSAFTVNVGENVTSFAAHLSTAADRVWSAIHVAYDGVGSPSSSALVTTNREVNRTLVNAHWEPAVINGVCVKRQAYVIVDGVNDEEVKVNVPNDELYGNLIVWDSGDKVEATDNFPEAFAGTYETENATYELQLNYTNLSSDTNLQVLIDNSSMLNTTLNSTGTYTYNITIPLTLNSTTTVERNISVFGYSWDGSYSRDARSVLFNDVGISTNLLVHGANTTLTATFTRRYTGPSLNATFFVGNTSLNASCNEDTCSAVWTAEEPNNNFNETRNVSFAWTKSDGTTSFTTDEGVQGNVTFYEFYLKQCDANVSYPLSSYFLFNEMNGSNVTGDVVQTFTYSVQGVSKTNAYTFSGVHNVSICIYPSPSILPFTISSFEEYSADGFYSRHNYMRNAEVMESLANTTIYLIPTTDGQEVQFKVKQDGVSLSNVDLQILKFFASDGTYKAVDTVRIGSDAIGVGYVDTSGWYKWKVYDQATGQILYESSQPEQVICSSSPCQKIVSFSSNSSTYALLPISQGCQIVNESIVCNYADGTGRTHYIRFVVTHNGVLLCNQTIQGSSGQCVLDLAAHGLNASEGVYSYYIYRSASPEILASSGFLDARSVTSILGDSWWIAVLAVVIGAGMVSFWDVRLAVLMGGAGFFLSAVVGLLPIGLAAASAVLLGSVLVAFVLR